MAGVAGYERLGASGHGDFEKAEVFRVRKLNTERRRRDSNALRFDLVEQIGNVLCIEGELPAMEHGAVLRKDAVVHEERDLSGQKKIHDAAGISFGVQEAGDEDVRVENDPQAGRRRRRAFAISRLISAIESLSAPVSAALRRIRDTARTALALRIASTVSSRRVSSTPTRTPTGFPLAVSTRSSFESADHTRPGRLRSSRTLTYFTLRV
jgi:hypothetical protein